MIKLKKILDRFYREYNFNERVPNDPVEFPLRYKNPRDIEVSGFIASCFAYGKVELFKAAVEKILSVMGTSPYHFLMEFDLKKSGRLFHGIRYRFNENNDILSMLFIIHHILKQYESLEAAFKKNYGTGDRDIEKGLAGFIAACLNADTSEIYGNNVKPRGLLQFFPSPENRSACKRSNLFLRWMIRDRDIDFGIWKEIPMNKLIIPLDTHIARISKCLGLTDRKSQDWKTAVEITEALKIFDPEDPVKYDFALCHHGITGMCKGRKEITVCRKCIFGG